MITRLTNFVIRGYQGYAIDKSLIKKVFSVRKPKPRKGTAGTTIKETEVSRKPTFYGCDQN